MNTVITDDLRYLQSLACDVIIQAGQSNALGYGQGGIKYTPVDEALFAYPEFTMEDKVHPIYTGKVFVTHDCENAPPKTGNFASGFVPYYIKNNLVQGRKVLIIQTGVGGTGFARNHWGLEDIIYQKTVELIEWAMSLNKANKFKAILWHQGELDAVENYGWSREKRYETHLENVRKLIRDMRSRFGQAPFICGDFSQAWRVKNPETTAAIVDAMREACRLERNAAFVETDGLLENDAVVQNGDDIHFCRESLKVLGERYYDCYRQLICDK